MPSDTQKKSMRSGLLSVGAFLAAIGASACCIGPLVFLSLGIGGAWMTTLTSMDAVRPIFVVATLVFIGLAFRNLYLVPDACDTGEACTVSSIKRNQRIIFWVVSMFLIALLAFPWYAPFFFE